jgi:uncharacterized peroxidase-related enzyme
MPFIRTIPPEEATGALKEAYDRVAGPGPTQVLRAWSLRPDVLAAWQTLGTTIASHMDERRFELVTVVAASRMKCSVCTLQHGSMLQSKYMTAEQVQSVVCDYEQAGLDPLDEAIVAFAEHVVLHADEISQQDIDALREKGLDDSEIFDIVLVATFGMGWSSTNDAIGYDPSESFLDRVSSQFGSEMLEMLMVGRHYEVSDKPE